jgi:hypothetical protein
LIAAGNLGTQAARVLPEPYASGAAVFALLAAAAPAPAELD